MWPGGDGLSSVPDVSVAFSSNRSARSVPGPILFPSPFYSHWDSLGIEPSESFQLSLYPIKRSIFSLIFYLPCPIPVSLTCMESPSTFRYANQARKSMQ